MTILGMIGGLSDLVKMMLIIPGRIFVRQQDSDWSESLFTGETRLGRWQDMEILP